jgi:hypothetical protein
MYVRVPARYLLMHARCGVAAAAVQRGHAGSGKIDSDWVAVAVGREESYMFRVSPRISPRPLLLCSADVGSGTPCSSVSRRASHSPRTSVSARVHGGAIRGRSKGTLGCGAWNDPRRRMICRGGAEVGSEGVGEYPGRILCVTTPQPEFVECGGRLASGHRGPMTTHLRSTPVGYLGMLGPAWSLARAVLSLASPSQTCRSEGSAR